MIYIVLMFVLVSVAVAMIWNARHEQAVIRAVRKTLSDVSDEDLLKMITYAKDDAENTTELGRIVDEALRGAKELGLDVSNDDKDRTSILEETIDEVRRDEFLPGIVGDTDEAKATQRKIDQRLDDIERNDD